MPSVCGLPAARPPPLLLPELAGSRRAALGAVPGRGMRDVAGTGVPRWAGVCGMRGGSSLLFTLCV